MLDGAIVPPSEQPGKARWVPSSPGKRSAALFPQLTPLIGREREVAGVCDLLARPNVRLLVLSGPGGVGKTRLSLQSATDLVDAFPDGVHVVPLAPISTADLVLPTIAQVLGLGESADLPAIERLKDYLQDRHLLLLLDNFEQVITGAPLPTELLERLPPEALLARLGRRLQVLSSGDRDLPVRQQTLRNTIKWSYDLLDAGEQRLFRRLSVFVGGCTLDAAEAFYALPGNVTTDVLDDVGRLIDKNLLYQAEQEGNEPRLHMLETIREYGLECLDACGEAQITRRAHAAYYLALAEEAELQTAGRQQVMWLERLEREHTNLRAALHWLRDAGEHEQALRLGGALWWFWWVHGHLSEGHGWLESMLTAGKEVSDAVRAKALYGNGVLAYAYDDRTKAEALFT